MKTLLYFCAMSLLPLAVGCRLFDDSATGEGRSLLRQLAASPDSIAMEIIWARFAAGDPALNGEAWQEIDETRIPIAARRELANNGFRAGIIGPLMPGAIARALDLDTTPPDQRTAPADDEAAQTVDLTADPTTRRRLLQLRHGRRAEIQASDVCDTLPLLVSHQGELGGRIYHDAQAIYALQVDPQPNRTVRVELTPELHHGAPRIRWTGGENGVLRQAPLREREVYASMRIDVALAPGEMLVLVSLPGTGSSLGSSFHTADSADGPQQKLVLVRLAQVPPSDTFDDVASH